MCRRDVQGRERLRGLCGVRAGDVCEHGRDRVYHVRVGDVLQHERRDGVSHV